MKTITYNPDTHALMPVEAIDSIREVLAVFSEKVQRGQAILFADLWAELIAAAPLPAVGQHDGEDPIGELQSEARRAKLDEFIAAAAPSPAHEGSELAERMLRGLFKRPDLDDYGREQFIQSVMGEGEELTVGWQDFKLLAKLAQPSVRDATTNIKKNVDEEN